MRYIVSLLVSIGDTEVVLQVGNSKAGPDLTLVGLDCAVRAVFVELCLEYVAQTICKKTSRMLRHPTGRHSKNWMDSLTNFKTFSCLFSFQQLMLDKLTRYENY